MSNDAHSDQDFSAEIEPWNTKTDFRYWGGERDVQLTSKDYYWANEISTRRPSYNQAQDWYILCALTGRDLLSKAMVIDPDVRGGQPVIKGTGFTISQLLGEISESDGVAEIAEDFDLNVEVVRDFLNGLSLIFGRSYAK